MAYAPIFGTVVDLANHTVEGSVTVTVYPAGSVNNTTGALIGTPTASTIYADKDGTAASNPLTTDANGKYYLCAANGLYDLVAEKASHTTWWQCNVPCGPDPEATAVRAPLDWIDSDDYALTGDGVADDHTVFQAMVTAAAGKGLLIRAPATAYLVGTALTGIDVSAGTVIVLEAGTIIRANAAVGGARGIFELTNVDGVQIVCPQGQAYLEGQSSTNLTSNAGFGVLAYGVQGLRLEGITARYLYSDGFYFGIGARSAVDFSCQDVSVVNCYADSNGRNGGTITGGQNILVQGGVYENQGSVTGGAGSPEAGWDVEPNEPSEYLRGIRFVDVISQNNEGIGFIVAPANLTDTAADGVYDPVSVAFEGCRSYGDYIGFCHYGIDCTTNRVMGTVSFADCVAENSDLYGMAVLDKDYTGPVAHFSRATIINPNQSENTGAYYGAGFAVFRDSGASGCANIGGVVVDGLSIVSTDSKLTGNNTGIFVGDYSVGSGDPDVYDVFIRDPVSVSGAPSWNEMTFLGRGVVIDTDGRLAKDINTDVTAVGNFNYASIIHNASASAVRTLTLSTTVAVGAPRVRVEVRSATYALNITTGAGDSIIGWCGAAETIQGKPGASIELLKTAANTWTVIAMQGEWARAVDTLDNDAQVLTATTYLREFSNSAYSTGRALTLPACVAGQGDIVVYIAAAQTCTITRAGTDTILPGAATTLASATIGSFVRLRPTAAGWRIMEQIGTWA